MYRYLTVKFPYSNLEPSLAYSFSLNQERYKHEYATILFKDWEIDYNDIKPMSPVEITIKTPEGPSRKLNGYISHIEPIYSPGERSVEITVIGASYVMKNTSQTIYKNVTADQVLKKIARKYEFSYFAEPHKRVFAQISQAGRTDWQLLVWLAKRVGYTLRAENTSLFFYPLSKDYSEQRSSAKNLKLNYVETLGGTDVYGFKPLIGEHLQFDDEEDDIKSALAYAGVDRFAKLELKYAKQTSKKSTRKNSIPEQFDRFAVNTVVPDSEIARWEAEAAEERQRFGYRGSVEVIGDPTLRPDMPVYLSGLGREYSGYWVILHANHKIERTGLNTFVYTTELIVGIDSLGDSETWGVDRFATIPGTLPTRSIKPNVRNTQRKDKSKLKVVGFYIKSAKTQLNKTINKKIPATVRGLVVQSPKWTSTVTDLKTTSPAGKYKSSVVIKKTLSR